MSTWQGWRWLGTGVAALLVAGVLAAPAQGYPGAPGSSWVTREDAASGPSTTYSWTAPDASLDVYSPGYDMLSFGASAADGSYMTALFIPPQGQVLHAGVTYAAVASPDYWSPSASARMVVWRDGTLCGKTEDDLFGDHDAAPPARGWFRINELEYNELGQVIHFAAVYELNCRFVGGPPGAEGSIAINATSPAAEVPSPPPTPAAITGLSSSNVYPNRYSMNTTTLSWQNPAGYGAVSLDMVQSEDPLNLPDLVGAKDGQLYYGRASSWRDNQVDFMDTRTYRLVPFGPTGRMGPASVLLVKGTRLSIPEPTDRIMIGQDFSIAGRLSLSWDYTDFADVMDGPGLANKVVLLCEQTVGHYVDDKCDQVDRVRTGSDGRFKVVARPQQNTWYEVMVPPTHDMVGNRSLASSRIFAMVAPHTDLTAPGADVVSARASARSARHGAAIRFSTSRARRGSRGVVFLQRRDGRKWNTIAQRRLAGPGRRLAIPYVEHRAGVHDYRVVKPGDKKHVTGYSRVVRVRVR